MDKDEHSLKEQHCIPYQGGISPLDSGEINDFLVQLNNNWQVNEKGPYIKNIFLKILQLFFKDKQYLI